MKRQLIYILIFVCTIFIFPSLCTKSRIDKKESKDKIEKNEIIENKLIEDKIEKSISKHEYSKYSTLKLLHSKTGKIEEIPIDEYLYGTVSAEMPVDYEIEALKAQAIVSRTYTIYQIEKNNNKHGDADICDDYNCCQAWISKEDRMNRWEEDKREDNWNKIVKSVNDTSGKIITYDGDAINAFFHSNSGGITEIVSNVWGGRDFPYIQSVETSGENEYDGYNSEVIISKSELLKRIKENYQDIEIDYSKEDSIKIIEHTGSGRVKTIKIGNKNLPGTEIRKILGLRSTNFSFRIDGENIIFSVIGYGHGVGMSQTGANSMAKSGHTCEEIIKHFYSGVEINNI